MTPAATDALANSQVVLGYKTYIKLIESLLEKQEVVSSGMGGEMGRAKTAVEKALSGLKVAVVSSGDAGVYGMAGLVLEICRGMGIRIGSPGGADEADFHLEVLPGIPALAAGAALLGAPLMHDFASISLSDLLTPWEAIEKRIDLAARGDFVIVVYNPKSKKRDRQLNAFREILLKHRPPDTPVGIVTGAMRDNQRIAVSTLERFTNEPIDMQTVLFVGNGKSYAFGTLW